MSTPASAWRGTIALTAARPAAAIVSASMLSPRARRTKRPVKFSGRGRLPACVVRIRSELRRINGPARCGDGRPARIHHALRVPTRSNAGAVFMSQDGLHLVRPDRSRCAAGLVAAYEQAAAVVSGPLRTTALGRKPEVICSFQALAFDAKLTPALIFLERS